MRKKRLWSNSEVKGYSRREFVGKIAGLSAVASLGGVFRPIFALANPNAAYPPRTRKPNPFITTDGKPLLIVVSGSDFATMLQAGLARLGGLGKLIDNNQDVLIKPNLNAVDVYPAISGADAIATLAQEVVKTTSGFVDVGDVSFHPTDQVYQHTNLATVLANTGAVLQNFTTTYKVRQPSWSAAKPDYQVYSQVFNTSIIISFACIKRHFLGRMSAALKNNVGAIAGANASLSRGYFHGLSGEAFLKEIAEIAALVNPELTIVDARSLLAGNGPFSNMSGAKIIDGVNRVILSGDMIAVDLYCARLLQSYDDTFKASEIDPTIVRAHELGLGVQDLSRVEIVEIDTTPVENRQSAGPDQSELYQNYPNPFNAGTEISFRIERANSVRLDIFNVRGQKISNLINKTLLPGKYSVKFQPENIAGGIYLAQLTVGSEIFRKPMTLLK